MQEVNDELDYRAWQAAGGYAATTTTSPSGDSIYNFIKKTGGVPMWAFFGIFGMLYGLGILKPLFGGGKSLQVLNLISGIAGFTGAGYAYFKGRQAKV